MKQETIDKFNKVQELVKSGFKTIEAVKSIGWNLGSYYTTAKMLKKKSTRVRTVTKTEENLVKSILNSKYSDTQKIQALKALV